MGIIEGEEGGWIGRTKTAKDKILQQLQSAMINLYKADKYLCTKHMAAMDATSILHTVTEIVNITMRLLCQEVSTEQRSLRVILILCMVPLIVKLTYNYCVLLYK